MLSSPERTFALPWQLHRPATASRPQSGGKTIDLFLTFDEGERSRRETISFAYCLQAPGKIETQLVRLSPVAFIFTLLGFVALLSTQAGMSQAALSPPSVCVTTIVDDRSLVTLKGNTDALWLQHEDQGAIAPSSPSGVLRLFLQRDPTRGTGLRRFLDDIHNSHSPQYHKWFPSQGYGSNFDIADEDLSVVKEWLQRQAL